ncbi:hypothetical protein GPECTOR_460g367 [Gonium pectorale]|uniref:Protein kinase domain-containing protein n=1 Tax=Gonium pectorale TaxID=33097 RepID=A0A150FV02_GONPE|nr:hypothetical protein GPECTOR_460g367 [Gonium pectorale]|eukprot:KXZ41453.1 hypothetical protein GPECTOR_460g367 [Gonium pectorale]
MATVAHKCGPHCHHPQAVADSGGTGGGGAATTAADADADAADNAKADVGADDESAPEAAQPGCWPRLFSGCFASGPRGRGASGRSRGSRSGDCPGGRGGSGWLGAKRPAEDEEAADEAVSSLPSFEVVEGAQRAFSVARRQLSDTEAAEVQAVPDAWWWRCGSTLSAAPALALAQGLPAQVASGLGLGLLRKMASCPNLHLHQPAWEAPPQLTRAGASAGSGVGPAIRGLTSSHSLGRIPLDVNFATEVEPIIRQRRFLGEGAYGTVYEGVWRGRPVAVKIVNVNSEEERLALAREALLCARFRSCERVVQLLGASLGLGTAGAPLQGATTAPPGMPGMRAVGAGPSAPPPAWGLAAYGRSPQPPGPRQAAAPRGQPQAALIMELCEGKNLRHRIHHQPERPLEYPDILKIACDLAEGLTVLHQFGVVHRDLKPLNVLLDKAGRAKIADFGHSRQSEPYRSAVTVSKCDGTPYYMAPEAWNGSHLTVRADTYSLGCILYEALTRRVPYDELAPMAAVFALQVRHLRPS